MKSRFLFTEISEVCLSKIRWEREVRRPLSISDSTWVSGIIWFCSADEWEWNVLICWWMLGFVLVLRVIFGFEVQLWDPSAVFSAMLDLKYQNMFIKNPMQRYSVRGYFAGSAWHLDYARVLWSDDTQIYPRLQHHKRLNCLPSHGNHAHITQLTQNETFQSFFLFMLLWSVEMNFLHCMQIW
jgi:hypothetical protein